MVFNAMKVLFGIDDLRAIGESPLLNITTGLDSEHVLQKDATDASK